MALPPLCIPMPHALARQIITTTDTPSRFGVPPCREHRLYLGELDPRPPHRASSGHFQRIETAPPRATSHSAPSGGAVASRLRSRTGRFSPAVPQHPDNRHTFVREIELVVAEIRMAIIPGDEGGRWPAPV